MIRVIVRGDHAGHGHPVGGDRGEQVGHGIGRIDENALAGAPVADDVHEVDHLGGERIVDREVATAQQLAEVQTVVAGRGGRHGVHPTLARCTAPLPLGRLESGQTIIVGGDRFVTVDDELAAAFRARGSSRRRRRHGRCAAHSRRRARPRQRRRRCSRPPPSPPSAASPTSRSRRSSVPSPTAWATRLCCNGFAPSIRKTSRRSIRRSIDNPTRTHGADARRHGRRPTRLGTLAAASRCDHGHDPPRRMEHRGSPGTAGSRRIRVRGSPQRRCRRCGGRAYREQRRDAHRVRRVANGRGDRGTRRGPGVGLEWPARWNDRPRPVTLAGGGLGAVRRPPIGARSGPWVGPGRQPARCRRSAGGYTGERSWHGWRLAGGAVSVPMRSDSR